MSLFFGRSLTLSRRSALAALASAIAGLTHAGVARAGNERPLFLYFWAVGCPHCARAKPLVAKLEKQHRDVRFESHEVKKSADGRRRFAKEVRRLGIRDPGVPMFVCGDEHVMGWVPGETERSVRQMLGRCKKSAQ